MDKISINLLPSDILLTTKEKSKRTFYIRLAVLILVVMVAITGILFLLRFSQNQRLAKAQSQLQSAKDKVGQYQNQENLVFYLKERLQDISTLSDKQSPFVQTYNMIYKLTPPGLSYSSITLDKPTSVVLSSNAENSTILKQYFTNLTDSKINQNKINHVKIDSLSRDQNGRYRVDLTITTT